MKKFGYTRNEKLKQKKDITLLFEKGKWKTCGPIRIIFYKVPASEIEAEKIPITEKPKIGVSVSKRYFKKAVDRNRIKRLLRDAYRHNKDEFQNKFGEKTLAMLFWNSKDKPKNLETVETEFLNLCKSKK